MFSKRTAELQSSDIETVVAEQWQESSQLELKETLPSKKKGGDPWLSTQESIGDHARNQIVEEVIAFANAHGGALIVGIAETADKPARVATLAPLPKCHDLADRLKLMCRDCIEPKLALIDASGVTTGKHGEGVVVRCV